MRKFLFVAIILAASVLAGCAAGPLALLATPTPVPCRLQSPDLLPALNAMIDDWIKVTSIASHAVRPMLDEPIARMQSMRQDLDGMAVPSCALPVKAAFLGEMDATIDYYQDFKKQTSDLDSLPKLGKMAQASYNFFVFFDDLRHEGEAAIPTTPAANDPQAILCAYSDDALASLTEMEAAVRVAEQSSALLNRSLERVGQIHASFDRRTPPVGGEAIRAALDGFVTEALRVLHGGLANDAYLNSGDAAVQAIKTAQQRAGCR